MGNRLSVAIATAGRPDLLRRTLQSLAACTKPAGYFETVVVENGTRGQAEQVVAEFRSSLNARYLYVARANKSAALNAALESGNFGLVFFTDDDVWVESETLAAYERAAREIAGGCFFGGATVAEYEAPPPEWLVNYLPRSAREWHWQGPGNEVTGPGFLGFNWAAFASDLRAAGGFDVSRGPGTESTGQETDMQRRLLASGLKGIYVGEAVVRHFVSARQCSPQWVIERKYRHGIEMGRLSAANRPAIFGYPLWIVRRWCKGVALGGLAAVAGTPRTRLEARIKQSYNRGMVEGLRVAARRHLSPHRRRRGRLLGVVGQFGIVAERPQCRLNREGTGRHRLRFRLAAGAW